VTRYFFSEGEADRALAAEGDHAAVYLAGARSDLDWDQTFEELD
jgi:hypothetical protein